MFPLLNWWRMTLAAPSSWVRFPVTAHTDKMYSLNALDSVCQGVNITSVPACIHKHVHC